VESKDTTFGLGFYIQQEEEAKKRRALGNTSNSKTAQKGG